MNSMNLMMYGGIALAVVGMAFFWWRKRRGNKSHRNINVFVITEDRRIVAKSFPVELGYAVQHATSEAWVTADDCYVYKRGTPNVSIFAHERSSMPQAVTPAAAALLEKYDKVNENRIPQEICRVGEERMLAAITQNVVGQDKTAQAELFTVVLLSLLCLFGLLVLLTFAAGKC